MAVITYNMVGESWLDQVIHASVVLIRARPYWAMSSTRLRSWVSAITPASGDRTTMGMSLITAIAPRAYADSVNKYICHNTAVCCIRDPVSETI